MDRTAISWDTRYAPSAEVLAREIEGEIVIIPLTGGPGQDADDLFTLNTTGRAIWQLLDGQHTLRQVVEVLVDAFDAPKTVIEEDVLGLLGELTTRRLVITVE